MLAVGGVGIGRSSVIGRLLGCLPLGAEVLIQPFFAALSTVAALPVASEAGGRIEQVGAVDPDGACLQLGCNVESKVDVLAPDRGRETIACVVAEGHGFGGRA